MILAESTPLTGLDPFGLTDGSAPSLTMHVRSRHYDPTTGRFATLDPFAGSRGEPMSLHKYLYAHANPVMGIDPGGLFFTLVGQATTTSIRTFIQNPYVAAIAKGYDTADTLVESIKLVGMIISGQPVNPLIIAGLLTNFLPFGSLLDKGTIVGRKVGRLDGVSESLGDALKGFKQTSGRIDDKAVELIGSLGAIGTARKLGFEAVEDFPTRYRGFDGVFRNPNGGFVIVEAKGGGWQAW